MYGAVISPVQRAEKPLVLPDTPLGVQPLPAANENVVVVEPGAGSVCFAAGRPLKLVEFVQYVPIAFEEQIVKQLNKLADVMKVQDFREGEFVDRELVLVKVSVDSKTRAEVMQITDIFRAKIVDVQPQSLTIEITGDESKVDKLLHLMKSFGITELTRTGKVAMGRKSEPEN